MKKIYLAVPYSNDPIRGFVEANHRAAKLMLEGNIVFSPISHSHPIYIHLKKELPVNTEFWLTQDLPFIEWCDELYVLCLSGWKDSNGIKAEIEHAKKLGKPIIFIK